MASKIVKRKGHNAGTFKAGHAKRGGRKPGVVNKVQILEVPIPLDRISSVTETLQKYGVDPIKEILKLCGFIDDGVQRWPLMAHQKASLLVQLAAMQKRESGTGEPDPQTPDGSTGKKDIKAMSTDELLKRVLRATHDEQLQRTSSG